MRHSYTLLGAMPTKQELEEGRRVQTVGAIAMYLLFAWICLAPLVVFLVKAMAP